MVVWDGHSLNCRIGGLLRWNCFASKRSLRIVGLRECGCCITGSAFSRLYMSYVR